MKLPEDPGWGIGYFIVSNSLESIIGNKNPKKTKMIRSSDNNIYAIIKIHHIEKTARIRWAWYGPDKKIVKRSEYTDVNRGKKFLEYFLIWNSLDKRFFKNKKGGWSVAVIVNGRLFATKNFNIN